MTISQVARLAGVGVETVRFYEREGLLHAIIACHLVLRHFAKRAKIAPWKPLDSPSGGRVYAFCVSR